MITQTFRSKRKVVYPPPTVFNNYKRQHVNNNAEPQVTAWALARNITVAEFERRDALVKEQAAKVRLFAGQIAYPDSQQGYEQYGPVRVIGKINSYRELPIDEPWPASDMPYIVSFHPVNDANSVVNCTWNYLNDHNKHINCC